MGEFLTRDAMILGEVAHGDVADWSLAAQSPVEAIEPQFLPRPEIEAMPGLRFGIIRRDLHLNESRFLRIFGDKVRQPIVIAFLRQPPAEGFSEFFAAPSTNSTVIRESFCAHQSTAVSTSR